MKKRGLSRRYRIGDQVLVNFQFTEEKGKIVDIIKDGNEKRYLVDFYHEKVNAVYKGFQPIHVSRLRHDPDKKKEV